MSDLQTRHPDSVGLTSVCGHLLRRAQQVHNAYWLDEVGSDPTSPQYAVLAAIAATPGADQREVSEAASLDTSTTMDIVARLTGRGWVARERSPSDARRDILTPAARAVEALTLLRTKVQRVQDRLLAPLPDEERGEFTDLLRRTARVDPQTQGGGYSPLHIPGHLLRRAQQVHTALFAVEFDRELTGPQYAALHVLAAHPSISQRQLGDEAALDKSTAADLVQRLARRGWITRERDAADGRRRVLSLSRAGEEAARGFTPRVTAVQERLMEPLDRRDRERLLALLVPVAYVAGY
ncbi:MarR family winged helix-turn-helix transcriptional regulator [Microbacterium sp. zg.B48]|uniref:MarR family winged helix-turn-helix transcriptional regulator n=1 Tax=Microbacterium sp. zg.B48 TaxID=2969408 RepID=UPI00214B7AED|nr:MarR family winged helix-turn-helix transcriptional regulator [Microbacterium sp. zg.B48]MCR2764307.1 MarR family winged helix-turn-helix transcriptional regulator [Microbacterium sp. zg.B48]